MRIGIVADTHGVLDERVLVALTGCDLILHAGDVGDPEILERLRGISDRVVAVRGNNDVDDKWPATANVDPRSLPESAREEAPGGSIVVVHGDRVLPAAKRHERLRARYPEARLVIYGHSHRLSVDRTARPWVANPGAAGRARTYGGPSLILLRARVDRWQLLPRRFEPAGSRR